MRRKQKEGNSLILGTKVSVRTAVYGSIKVIKEPAIRTS